MRNLAEGDANFCSRQWKPDIRRLALDPSESPGPWAATGWYEKAGGPGGRVGAARWGKGWFLYFLWHGLQDRQRKWISNDGPKPKIRNTFPSSCRSHVSMEILLMTLILFPVAGMLLRGFFYSKKKFFSHRPFTMQWVCKSVMPWKKKFKLADFLFSFHFFPFFLLKLSLSPAAYCASKMCWKRRVTLRP